MEQNDGMTFKFHNTCSLCLRPLRVTNVFYLSENNGYPKVAAPFARKIRKYNESRYFQYFRNSTVFVDRYYLFLYYQDFHEKREFKWRHHSPAPLSADKYFSPNMTEGKQTLTCVVVVVVYNGL